MNHWTTYRRLVKAFWSYVCIMRSYLWNISSLISKERHNTVMISCYWIISTVLEQRQPDVLSYYIQLRTLSLQRQERLGRVETKPSLGKEAPCQKVTLISGKGFYFRDGLKAITMPTFPISLPSLLIALSLALKGGPGHGKGRDEQTKGKALGDTLTRDIEGGWWHMNTYRTRIISVRISHSVSVKQ